MLPDFVVENICQTANLLEENVNEEHVHDREATVDVICLDSFIFNLVFYYGAYFIW